MILLAAAGWWQNLAGAHFTPQLPGTADFISVNDQRFRALRDTISSQLRPKHGEIGYIGDVDPASVNGSAARFLAQYALAPLVFVPAPPFPTGQLDPALRGSWQPRPSPTANPEWFAGNFDVPGNAAGIARREELVIVRDFGAGVMLLRRAPQ